MQLVEQHIINKSSEFYSECDSLAFKAKNLYNCCLYTIRQAYINEKVNLIYDLHSLMKDTEQYKELPAKVSSTVLLMVQHNFKSFFKANAEFYKNPSKFKGKPRLPKYLDFVNGRFIVSYTNQAISKKVFKKSHKVKLSNSNIEVFTKVGTFDKINCVRIVPRNNYYVLEIIYTIEDKPLKENNDKYLSIDLGVNNLATLVSNDVNFKPIIINGKPLKSINNYYNKQIAKYTSILEKRNKQKVSNRTTKITNKRKNKIDNYLHKASKAIIEISKTHSLNTIIIGKNDGWKQEVNMNKTNNQNFVNIPHSRFIDMIKYKCEKEGINLIIIDESYTSKASFLDLDEIATYKKGDSVNHSFSGYRQSRGLYKSKTKNVTINADVNGSYNILRKAVPNIFDMNGIEGLGVNPMVITMNK